MLRWSSKSNASSSMCPSSAEGIPVDAGFNVGGAAAICKNCGHIAGWLTPRRSENTGASPACGSGGTGMARPGKGRPSCASARAGSCCKHACSGHGGSSAPLLCQCGCGCNDIHSGGAGPCCNWGCMQSWPAAPGNIAFPQLQSLPSRGGQLGGGVGVSGRGPALGGCGERPCGHDAGVSSSIHGPSGSTRVGLGQPAPIAAGTLSASSSCDGIRNGVPSPAAMARQQPRSSPSSALEKSRRRRVPRLLEQMRESVWRSCGRSSAT
mmetsp:Transcript_99015/g.280449  ORF Transcript_99015/g.280449 Transcript_99015/m.280449 type:complete len:266 (+) Transcript_99015:617-1414(+)